MKKYLILIILLTQYSLSFSQVAPWVVTNDTSSIVNYTFSNPGSPAKMDTLGFKAYSYALDTLIGFQVVEIKYPPCDSSYAPFTNALLQNNGDTLAAIASILFATSNSVILSSQPLSLNGGFSGMQVHFKYNTLNYGRVVVAYEKLYYRKDFLLTFTITGFQNDQINLDANKNQFFNSISF